MKILGVDIGGTGIKGGIVDTAAGEMVTERHRILTPHPATPDDVADVVRQVAAHFSWDGPVGCTFPGIVRGGMVHSAANLDDAWIGLDAASLFAADTGLAFTIVNDADAAGVAEMRFGAGRGNAGIVIVLTFGTGIGSAVFVRDVLLPNTELGHLELRGRDAEKWAADSVREAEELSWKKWSKRVEEYMSHLELLFSPDLFVIGGGASKHSDKFLPHLDLRADVVPATLLNEAGIIGAAVTAVPSS